MSESEKDVDLIFPQLQGEAIQCPKCSFLFVLFRVAFDKKGNPMGVENVIARNLGAIPLYCPHCATDVNSFQKEIDSDLDRYNKWKAMVE